MGTVFRNQDTHIAEYLPAAGCIDRAVASAQIARL
jgi:hypothetical protein